MKRRQGVVGVGESGDLGTVSVKLAARQKPERGGSLKVAVGFAFTGACVGEFVAATRGLGYLLLFAQSTYVRP